MAETTTAPHAKEKSLESWIWDAACSIRGAKDAPKYKDYILPLIVTKRLCDVFDDELNRIAKEVGSRAKAFKLVRHDHKLVRFYLPFLPDDPGQPVWSVIRQLSDQIGEGVTTHMRSIARENHLQPLRHGRPGIPARHRPARRIQGEHHLEWFQLSVR
jgi:type I restriction enzyme M protein